MTGQAALPSRSLILAVIASIAAFALLIGLGTWQLQRLHWKEGLIAAATTRSVMAPVPPPAQKDWPTLDPEKVEYRHIILHGRFLNQGDVQVFTSLSSPRGRYGGTGYWVMTPFLQSDGSTILVNRGFVPADRREPASRREGVVEGETSLTGLLRWSEARNMFTPADDPVRGEWFTRDPQAIGKAEGLGHVAPFFVDADVSAPGGLPQGGETKLTFPNRHFEYALTWYGLAVALLCVLGAVVIRHRRETRAPRP